MLDRQRVCFFVASVLLTLIVGCAPVTMQFRMAEPTVALTEDGRLDPPAIYFERFSGKTRGMKKNYSSVLGNKPAAYKRNKGVGSGRIGVPPFHNLTIRPMPFSHCDKAYFVWDNPQSAYRNRVDLKRNAIYRIALTLPEAYELRRLQMLQSKSETLYESIDMADTRLRENTRNASQTLSDGARAVLIKDCAQLQAQIDVEKLALVQASDDAAKKVHRAKIDGYVDQIARREEALRDDDLTRDKMLSPALVDSLANQIQDWRGQLGTVKGRIVALELMVQNANEPFPRVINGWLETMDQTPFTRVGAVPFVVEDEYLDWIREDKTVTVVFYDPNQSPTDPAAADARSSLPEYWPSHNLMVVERSQQSGPHRLATGGTAAGTSVEAQDYANVSAQTLRDGSGYTRTYLRTADKARMWVFGPDLTPPQNIEVWLQDDRGLPVRKVYPHSPANPAGEVFVSQLAGVEGGSFDPIAEAEKRGQILAIAMFGNWRGEKDQKKITAIYAREMKKHRQK